MNHPALRHPGRWLWLLLIVPVALGIARLRFDVEVLDLLPPDLKAVQGLKIYQQYFSNARELIVTLKSSDPAQTEAAAKSLSDQLRPLTNLVSSVISQAPWMEHPEQGAELTAYLWFNQPPSVFGQLTNRLAPANLDTELQKTREELASSLSPEELARASYDPFGLTHLPESIAGAAPSFSQGQQGFGSPDGTFRLVFIRAKNELRGYRECAAWLGAIQPVIAAATGATHVTVGYTGRPAFVTEVASGMQFDMTTSVGGTAAIIAVLFWIAHRRVKPMIWLLTLLAIILGSTLALGGLIYGAINVVSIGFAAILLGLAVDYAVVHYQEALAHPDLSIPQIRHAIAPSIFWAATTTITAFLVLNFGGLPGLGQLGTLVGLGVALSALIMIFEYLPPLFPDRKTAQPGSTGMEAAETIHAEPAGVARRGRRNIAFAATAAVLLAAFVILLVMGPPPIDPTANALRPKGSPAYAALAEIQASLTKKREPLWLVVGGETVANVARHLDEVQAVLSRAESNKVITGFTFPTALWPHPQYQEQNRNIAKELATKHDLLQQAAKRNGFAENSLALSDRMLQTWRMAAEAPGTFWPDNELSRWVFDKFAARTSTNYFALGLVTPPEGAHGSDLAKVSTLEAELPRDHVWVSGWELLGHQIFTRVKANLWKLVAPMVVLVLLSLWLAFHRPREILLSISVLLMSGLCLLVVMRLTHWSWNLLNLMAIPLILGTGVDYSIFMQMALRRYHGDHRTAYRSVGRALFLCGGTAIAAFASLSLSSNAGMASLGQVCAVGIAANMIIAVLLLPDWWSAFRPKL